MNEAMSGRRRAYDHRLQELVCEEGSSWLLQGLGVPRSTAASWLRRGPRAVVTLDVVTKDTIELQAEVIRLRQLNEVLSAIVRLLFMLLRLAGVRLDETRIPERAAKAKILTAIARSRTALQLAVVLRVLGLSPSRHHAWNRLERACQLDDRSTCPRTTPTQLGRGSPHHACPCDQRQLSPHVDPRSRAPRPAHRDALRLPSNLGSTHSRTGVALDGTRLYLHAVIDNFYRRILAWKLAARLEPQSICAILSTAGAGLDLSRNPATVVADSGVENVNGDVDALLGR